MGFFLHSGFLFLQYRESGVELVRSIPFASVFVSCCLAAFYLCIGSVRRQPSLGALIGLAAFAVSTVFWLKPALGREIGSAWESDLFPIHVTLTLMGYSFFALAGCSALLYLLVERGIKQKWKWPLFLILPSLALPSLESLDKLSIHAVTNGFALLTFGLATGVVLSRQEWGAYWYWDPKWVLSLLIWMVYALLIQVRLFRGVRGRKLAYLCLVGFAAVLFTFVGLQLLFNTKHAFV